MPSTVHDPNVREKDDQALCPAGNLKPYLKNVESNPFVDSQDVPLLPSNKTVLNE